MDEGIRDEWLDLQVVGVRIMGEDDSTILLLQERHGTRLLPIWIGAVEAAVITLELRDDVAVPRPLTHDLLSTVIREFVGQAEGRALISAVDEGLFLARLQFLDLDFDARPSDAVAVALKLGWPIRCPRTLMDQVGVEVDEMPNDEVDEFRAFLDSVSADDFSTGEDTA